MQGMAFERPETDSGLLGGRERWSSGLLMCDLLGTDCYLHHLGSPGA